MIEIHSAKTILARRGKEPLRMGLFTKETVEKEIESKDAGQNCGSLQESLVGQKIHSYFLFEMH